MSVWDSIVGQQRVVEQLKAIANILPSQETPVVYARLRRRWRAPIMVLATSRPKPCSRCLPALIPT